MGRKRTVNRAVKVALVDVDRGHQTAFREACEAAGCPLVFKTIGGKSGDRLAQWADLVVVEADRSFGALHSAERARLTGTSLVGILVNWWSDLEWDAHQVADFVLHVPLAPQEVREVMTSTILARRQTALASSLAAEAAAEQVGPRLPSPEGFHPFHSSSQIWPLQLGSSLSSGRISRCSSFAARRSQW